MDSKMLCVGLLLAVFCLWSTEASPLESSIMDHSGQVAVDENYQKGYPSDDDMKADVHTKTSMVANARAKALANKAKAHESEARLLHQISRDRLYYYKEYTKLADEAKRRYREAEQLSASIAANIGHHLARQREWNSKAREAETQCKDDDLKAQQEYTQFQELERKADEAFVAASIANAQAYGYQHKAERMLDASKEMRRRADALMNDAKTHYTRGKEDESRATAEKVKAHQQAEDSQKHHSASRAYQQEAVKTRLASRSNIMKYIQNSLMAERSRSAAREAELKSEMEHKLAEDLAKQADHAASISKILTNEYATYSTRAKHEETRSLVYAESSRETEASAIDDSSALLQLAQAKNEKEDVESPRTLSIYPADDPVKISPDEEKEGYQIAQEGF